MWMLGAEGYGSISSWYQWFSAVGAPGTGFGTWNAPSSSQTRCHLVSISRGSYLGVIEKRPLERKNLSEERPWGGRRGLAALVSLV
jgi:hypothetical protein